MDDSAALRYTRESSSLARRGASGNSIPDRLVHAGRSRRSARQSHDAPYFVRPDHPRADFVAACLAYHPSGGAREFATTMAASFLRSGALAALCIGSRYDRYGLAIRIVPGLVDLLFQSRSTTDVSDKKRGRDPSDRWLASDRRVGPADCDRCSRSRCACAYLHLS